MPNDLQKAYVLGTFAGHVQECCRKNTDLANAFDDDKIAASYEGMGTTELKRAYFRGFVDVVAVLDAHTPYCRLYIANHRLQKAFEEFHSGIPHRSSGSYQAWSGTNAIDFLEKVFKGRQEEHENNEKYNTYISWLSVTNEVREPRQSTLPYCEIFKADVNAFFPTKNKESDVGYDLTVIKVAKKLSDKVTLYDTGIKVSVENGYYAEVVPRSSLSKSGYMLANSVGIIDRSYLGNILVALVKVDESVPDFELPFRCCQLIFRPQVHVDMKEVDEPFEETARGEGGFGSSG